MALRGPFLHVLGQVLQRSWTQKNIESEPSVRVRGRRCGGPRVGSHLDLFCELLERTWTGSGPAGPAGPDRLDRLDRPVHGPAGPLDRPVHGPAGPDRWIGPACDWIGLSLAGITSNLC